MGVAGLPSLEESGGCLPLQDAPSHSARPELAHPSGLQAHPPGGQLLCEPCRIKGQAAASGRNSGSRKGTKTPLYDWYLHTVFSVSPQKKPKLPLQSAEP